MPQGWQPPLSPEEKARLDEEAKEAEEQAKRDDYDRMVAEVRGSAEVLGQWSCGAGHVCACSVMLAMCERSMCAKAMPDARGHLGDAGYGCAVQRSAQLQTELLRAMLTSSHASAAAWQHTPQPVRGRPSANTARQQVPALSHRHPARLPPQVTAKLRADMEEEMAARSSWCCCCPPQRRSTLTRDSVDVPIASAQQPMQEEDMRR